MGMLHLFDDVFVSRALRHALPIYYFRFSKQSVIFLSLSLL